MTYILDLYDYCGYRHYLHAWFSSEYSPDLDNTRIKI